MGTYIETNSARGKTEFLANRGAKVLGEAPSSLDEVPPFEVLICVVDNGPFEASAVVESARDLVDFKVDDGRAKTWLSLDRPMVDSILESERRRGA